MIKKIEKLEEIYDVSKNHAVYSYQNRAKINEIIDTLSQIVEMLPKEESRAGGLTVSNQSPKFGAVDDYGAGTAKLDSGEWTKSDSYKENPEPYKVTVGDTQSEWEKEFDEKHRTYIQPKGKDCEETINLKDFISQEKAKSFEDGLAMGNKTKEIAINNIITDANTARNRALDEAVEKVNKEFGGVNADNKYTKEVSEAIRKRVEYLLLSLKKPTELHQDKKGFRWTPSDKPTE